MNTIKSFCQFSCSSSNAFVERLSSRRAGNKNCRSII